MMMQFPLCPGGRIVEVEGATQADLFRELAGAVEVFGETHCGECGEDAIVPIYRVVGTDEHFEWGCLNPKCGARLTVGIRKGEPKGRLFPVRKLDARGKPDWKSGTAGTHNGWTKYRGDTDTGSAGPRTPPPTRPAPPAAADPEPDRIVPGALLTAAQREAIGTALRVSGIGRQTFLRWCGYGAPEVIPQTEFPRLLAAAQKPPKDLLAVQAR